MLVQGLLDMQCQGEGDVQGLPVFYGSLKKAGINVLGDILDDTLHAASENNIKNH